MKSKKIVALALTAAMAISMASMTAFAKAEYETGSKDASIKRTYATITLTKADLTALKKAADDYAADNTKGIGGIDSVDDANFTAKLTYKALKAYDSKNTLADKSDLNTPTATYLGWDTPQTDKPNNTTDFSAGTENKLKDDTEIQFVKDGTNDAAVAYVKAVWRNDSGDDEQIRKNIKAIEDKKSDDKATKDREDDLKKKDALNAAENNVKTDEGPKTEKAPVTGPTAIEDSEDLHDFKVVNKDMTDSALAWVYQVTKPDGLVGTKNARVTLEAPKGYNPKDYKVAVYHVKGYCTYEKVKGLDIAKTDVTFWANDMSPYVLVLTPKDAVAGTSTGNPSTGDFSAVPVAMLAAAALGATGFVAYKKRKAE